MAGNKYTPSSQVKKRISDWEGAAMHGSTIDPLSKKKVSKNNSIDNEASLFASKIPEEIRERVFSNQELADNLFSYSYNVGSHNFKKRVVPTLMNYYSGKASARDVADTMFASGDSKLRGLQKRRDYEKSHVVSALQKNSPIYKAQPPVTPIFTPDALRVNTPYPTYVESATPIPVMVPEEGNYITTRPQTPEERSAIQFNQRMENIQRLNRLFDIADIKNIEIPQYTPRTNPYVISSYSEGGKLRKKSWDDLSMEEKSEMIGVAVRQGYTNISDIRDKYNEFAEGGKIHIAPSKRGTFTAVAKKHGKSVQAFASQVLAHPENYSSAMRRKANFARNSRKWKHGEGGNLFDGTSQPTQQMFVREKNNNPIAFDTEGNLTDQVTGDKGIMNLPEVTIRPQRYSSTFEGNSDLAPELLRFTPVLGDALDAADVVKDAYNGDYLNASIGAGLFALPNFIEKPIKAIGKGAYKLLTAPTRKAAEKGRNTLIEAISSPWNRERWNFAAPTIDTNFIIEDLKQKASTVPFHYSKTRANLGANGETSSHIPPLVYYKDGKKVTDYSNSNLDIYIASDLGKEAYSTGIHEPIHYITNNSHGLLDVKAGNPIFTNLFEPVEIKYTDETLIPRGTLYQHLMTDYNDALLPKINKESRAFKSNDKYNMDKQENQTWLKTWFLTDIKPNLKNPNDASEIETFLNEHPEIIKNNSYVNTLMSDTRPGTNKEYSKALSKMLYSTLGIVGLSNINKND